MPLAAFWTEGVINVPLLGPQQNPDPTLSSVTGWTLGAGWSKVPGGFRKVPGESSLLSITSTGPAFIGQKLVMTAQLAERNGGGVSVFKGNTAGTVLNTTEPYVIRMTTTTGSNVIGFSAPTTFDGVVSFLGIREDFTMALASEGFFLTVTLRDSGGNQSNLNYQLVAADAAAAATAAADILTRLGLVTKAEVSGYSIQERFQENDFAYPADAENENRAVVTALLDGYANKPTTVVIPAPVDGIFVQPAGGPGYNVVDVTNTDLISYIDIWRVTGALATISDGEYVADSGSILRGKRTHRQSSRG